MRKNLKQINDIINKFSKKENNKIVITNVIGAFLVRGGGLLVSILTLPVFINYFGNKTVLGVWYTVLSVITWVLNFDLGIGNGLRNQLVISISEKNTQKSKELISSAYFLIGAIVIIISVLGFGFSSFVNWNHIFNISEDLISAGVILTVVRFVFLGIMAQFFLRLISSILFALQKSAVNNLLSLIVSVLQLIFILLAPSGTPEQNFLLLSKAYIFITTFPYLVVTIIIFSTSLKKMRPNIHFYRKNSAFSVMSLGGIFFVCQILYMIIINTNDFLITYFTVPENTVEYNIYSRLFSLAGIFVNLILTPIWSMVTKAIAEGELEWLQKLFQKAQIISGVVIVGEFLITIMLQFIINIWLGNEAIKVNYFYAVIFAIWGSVFIYHNILSTFTCGTGKMKLQAICYGIGVVFKFLFIWIVYNYIDSWIYIVISNIIILVPYCILQQKKLKKDFNPSK